ncbi:flavodoxin family protein [Carboxydothermus ferrireducens]|uniref:Multimeric flavodoxin WrbA n=1 Tax=Carboxydothermus ferrireducens DSM 11255 TaxID=1119529 RepID=A0ABX2R597_9THEO|nr:NAD(P)H-dependent oxidoreductase [Carboxydothermus ferrireducens]NYE56339.1 multimeric flavodoxin WrbA [Carboxydothermus ferrireducens DSM 11255]
MKVVVLNGSPNKNGNCTYLAGVIKNLASEYNAETVIINVDEIMRRQKIPYCIHCSAPCSGVCYKGTELEAAYLQLGSADAIIMLSPVYFGTVSAQLKAFWDKTRRLRDRKLLVNVVGAAATVGGSRFGGQETTISTLHDMMLVQGMTVVGDGLFTADAGHQGACFTRPAEEEQNGVKRLEILVKRVLEVAKATESLREKREVTLF